jgi:hypothetical protein
MRQRVIFGALLISFLGNSAARADIQPYFVQTPISSAAIMADPTLSNYKCWNLRVAVTGSDPHIPGPDFFTVAEILCQLSPGSFYSPVGGGDKPVAGGAANLAYDTYITAPNFVPATHDYIGIAGKSDQDPNVSSSGNIPTFPRAGEQQSSLSVTWALLSDDPNDHHNGDYEIARLTVSNDATGAVIGQVTSAERFYIPPPAVGFAAQFTQGTLNVIYTPEPVSVGLLSSTAVIMMRRRRV